MKESDEMSRSAGEKIVYGDTEVVKCFRWSDAGNIEVSF